MLVGTWDNAMPDNEIAHMCFKSDHTWTLSFDRGKPASTARWQVEGNEIIFVYGPPKVSPISNPNPSLKLTQKIRNRITKLDRNQLQMDDGFIYTRQP
jgi:hypothetical protein